VALALRLRLIQLLVVVWMATGATSEAVVGPERVARARSAPAKAAPAKAAPAKAAPAKAAPARSRAPYPRAGIAAARMKKPRWPTVELYHVNRRETLRVRIADDRGRPIKGLQKRVDLFLRCHHTNAKYRMNPRLTRLIYEAGRRWTNQRVEIISGYRHPSVAKNPKSPHMKGLACDFRVAGVKNTELRDYLRRTFPHIGVGYYPNSSFVHLDVRRGASAFWIDYSGPGEKSVYSDDPISDIKTARAETFKPGLSVPVDSVAQDEHPIEPPDGTGKESRGSIAHAPGPGAPAHEDPSQAPSSGSGGVAPSSAQAGANP
jgi:uncharacterized protein YcbK (DUF882 family)